MDLKEKLKNNEEEIPIIGFTFKPIKFNSQLTLGNLCFNTDKKINLFHRIMFRVLLGVKVERINNGKKTV